MSGSVSDSQAKLFAVYVWMIVASRIRVASDVRGGDPRLMVEQGLRDRRRAVEQRGSVSGPFVSTVLGTIEDHLAGLR